jgi:phosphatidylglycerol:prolipoprotein diacylglycerol transferase
MKTLMIIETVHGGMMFGLTYLAAFLIAAGIMVFHGLKKGYPVGSWLLILITGVVFFIIGDKVFTYSIGQWHTVFTEFRFPVAVEKNALGGIIGLLGGILFAKMVLRFTRPVFDSLAIALPVAMAVSRIGCLMAGCCFGIPTMLPVGIKYDAASFAYQAQLGKGLIEMHEHGSLAVHPVQLYQVIGCLMIAFIVWRTRKHWKSNGSMFLFSMLCYGFLRFFTEFLVDPASNSFAGDLLWGMNLVQWLVVASFFPGLIVLIVKETKPPSKPMNGSPVKVTEFRQLLLTAILFIGVLSGRNWFDIVEFSIIMLFIFPVVMLLFAEIYRNHSVAGFRWIPPVVIIGSFCLMAQKQIPAWKKGNKTTFTEVGVAGSLGKYYEELQRVGQFSCGLPSYQTLIQQAAPFYQAGINVSYNIWRGRNTKYTLGGRLFFGDEMPGQKAIHSGTGPVFGISPYASLNWNWFGFTTGFSLGQMKIPISKPISKLDEGDIISKDYSWVTFVPSVAVRFGPADILFTEAAFPGLFPFCTPYPFFKAGIGSGLGKTNGTKAAIGYCEGIYAQLVYPIKNTIVLEALYADNLASGNTVKRVFSFGIHYRFNYAKEIRAE